MSGGVNGSAGAYFTLEAVELTQNEWCKAGRFGSDYYLYVVPNAATRPELYIIGDPAANLQLQEREVRYLVRVEEITRAASAPMTPVTRFPLPKLRICGILSVQNISNG